MSVLYVEVVVRPEHVGGDDCGVAMAKLLEIRPVQRAKVLLLLYPIAEQIITGL